MKETNFIIYESNDNKIKVNVTLDRETVWLTQKQIAELFDVEVPAINKHFTNIYLEGELDKKATISKMEIVQKEGGRDVSRNLNFYNLDVIIAVGYRVNSKQATQFRIWATKILKEFIIKGFVLDDDRLKQGEQIFGKDYFQELLERVRSIRASERRIYQKITDIFAEIAIDYNNKSEIAQNFFATIQNKFHHAITGKTAAEIIYDSADAEKDYMGLQTWKNSPNGRILKSDSLIAKNYLSEKEIKKLERTIGSFFDYLENLIEQEEKLTMEDISMTVNEFLKFNRFNLLNGKGKISSEEAENKAKLEYDIFNKTQKIVSDFDRLVEKMREER